MYLLENQTRSYAWGSRTLLADLLGTAVSDEPQAELWIGAHPEFPSGLVDSEHDLFGLIASDPSSVLGTQVRAAFGDRLPYLMKVLAVERPLSLQVHPDDAQASAGFAADRDVPDAERVYKDPNHKAELVYAVTPFEALCGFRPVSAARDTFLELAHRMPGVREFAQLAHQLDVPDDATALRAVCRQIVGLAPDEIEVLADCLPGAAANSADPSLRVAASLAAAYPRDPAVLLAILMRHVSLAPGEALGVEPGMPHTYLHGCVVELTTCSDNTIRAGVTPKPTDPEQFLDVLQYRPVASATLRARNVGPAERNYTTGHPEFELTVVHLAPGLCVRWEPRPRSILVLDGKVSVTDETGTCELGCGESVFVPAGAGAVEVKGDGVAVQATTGV
ncbi:mannose-6-phosphate isomerase, class I [Nocardioidaceae bacterium SCSIO 66511]|nr:mannose-6-phosphate isomerase, class I [Nocardioidaceae bacterium SCSIO 66511]